MKKLGFGSMRLPLCDDGSINMTELCKMVDLFLERGYTYFDTAYMYHGGASETALREALTERFPRDAFVLADKLPLRMLKCREDCGRIFEEQLERCGVDYFDRYLLHNIDNASYAMCADFDLFGFVLRLREQGRVRRIGFSFHGDAPLLERVLTEHPETEFVQLQVNYLDWENADVQSRLCYETCLRHGKEVVIMEPVKGGALADLPERAAAALRSRDPSCSQASWALRFTAGLSGVSVVLSGMSNFSQAEENTALFESLSPLSEPERALLLSIADDINSDIAVPCTGCSYCTEHCPKGIPIPRYLELYNLRCRLGRLSSAAFKYRLCLERGAAEASECIGCRECVAACPQHLDIPENLVKFLDSISGD